MPSSYSLQESNGRFHITIKSELVKSKGWEKGEELDWKISGNKLKLTEGEQVTLQHSNNRYFVSVPLAEEVGWGKGEDLVWSVDGNGDLELKQQ